MELEEFRQDVLKRIRHQRGMPETKADSAYARTWYSEHVK